MYLCAFSYFLVTSLSSYFLLILNSGHKAQLTLLGLPSFSQHFHKRVQERRKMKRSEKAEVENL